MTPRSSEWPGGPSGEYLMTDGDSGSWPPIDARHHAAREGNQHVINLRYNVRRHALG